PANQAPTVDAGPNQTVAAGAAVNLAGTATDPENGTLTFVWTQTGGTALVTLTGGDTLTPSFNAPNAADTLVFTLSVSDGVNSAVTDSVTITVNSPDVSQVQQEFGDKTAAFMTRRMERTLRNDPRLYRLEHRGSQNTVVAAVSSSGSMTRANLDFSLSRDIGSGTYFWTEGRYTFFDDKRNASAVDGDYGVLNMGVDYSIGNSTILGLMVSFDRISEEETAVSDISGKGWMVGPYFSTALTDTLFLSGRVALGQSSNDASIVSLGTAYSGEFDTDRLLAILTLTGQIDQPAYRVLPEVSLGYVREEQDDYVVTDGITQIGVTGQSMDYGQISLAAEFQFPFGPIADNSFIFARPAITGVFKESKAFSGQSSVTSSLEVGYEATPSSNLRHGVSVGYDGIGDGDFDAWSIRSFLEFRF
ncbi:autotransporter outer membrane beta-barrel domain-containing protein, partial [Aestuariivita boseongensis]|uniref:autotransporter outer membrane beta-barrel domain-containing protein n=1 Tax=Aestuariivita boseongensis TaxID=1470562 RepID=UPI0012FBA652